MRFVGERIACKEGKCTWWQNDQRPKGNNESTHLNRSGKQGVLSLLEKNESIFKYLRWAYITENFEIDIHKILRPTQQSLVLEGIISYHKNLMTGRWSRFFLPMRQPPEDPETCQYISEPGHGQLVSEVGNTPMKYLSFPMTWEHNFYKSVWFFLVQCSLRAGRIHVLHLFKSFLFFKYYHK